MSSSFRKEIGKELNAIKKDLNRAMSNTLVEGLGFVTARSAVDTGRYRASWNISKNKPDDSVIPFKKKPKGHKRKTDIYGFKAKARILFDITKDSSAILSNNLEYAPYVDARFGDVIRTKIKMRVALRRRIKAIK